MTHVGPDEPTTSRRMRVAMVQNKVADHDLELALHRMERERIKNFQSHRIERVKLLAEMGSVSAVTPDIDDPHHSPHSSHDRLLSREELPSHQKMVHFVDDRSRRRGSHEIMKVDDLTSMPGSPRQHVRGRHIDVPSQRQRSQSFAQGGRRRSVSLSEADMLVRESALKAATNPDTAVNVYSKMPAVRRVMDKEMPSSNQQRQQQRRQEQRPQSAALPRIAALRDNQRSFSVDIDDLLKSAKRNGMLEPLATGHHGGCRSDLVAHSYNAPSPTAIRGRNMYAKRFSEPQILNTLTIPDMESDTTNKIVNSSSSGDEERESPELDENRCPFQPYSIGNLCVRNSKGAFEQKTGREGLRAWTGLSSPKSKNRRILHKKK